MTRAGPRGGVCVKKIHDREFFDADGNTLERDEEVEEALFRVARFAKRELIAQWGAAGARAGRAETSARDRLHPLEFFKYPVELIQGQ